MSSPLVTLALRAISATSGKDLLGSILPMLHLLKRKALAHSIIKTALSLCLVCDLQAAALQRAQDVSRAVLIL